MVWKKWYEGLQPDCIPDLPLFGGESGSLQLCELRAEARGDNKPASDLPDLASHCAVLEDDVWTNPMETAVPGLFLVLDFMSEKQEAALISAIDTEVWIWNRAQTRRVQMYGVKHDEQYRVHAKASVTPLPQYADDLIADIQDIVSEYFPRHADYIHKLGAPKVTEVFVNEYDATSSLQFHTDHTITFEEIIVGISLGAESLFRFQRCDVKDQEQVVSLPRRSIYFMTGPSRTDYKHGMREGDCQGLRRVSLTFRVVRESAIIK
jgi:alkylated DNA repair dioxygenase AlkB